MNTATLCHDLRCDHSNGERPRYYARQLITADDMTLEQDYFRSKLRLHNRMLHGWGIVCGAEVGKLEKKKADGTMESVPWNVVIKPGYILGPYGDEIVIDCDRTFDLRSQSLIGVAGEACVEEVDPWCSEAHGTCADGDLYLAVRYKEVMTRPVRVQPPGCGCDDSACEYSRLRDGYEIKVLRTCPAGPVTVFCPPCPEVPWVVLKHVNVDASGKVSLSNICRHVLKTPAVRSDSLPQEHRRAVITPPHDVEASEELSRERIVSGALSTSATATKKKVSPAKKKSK